MLNQKQIEENVPNNKKTQIDESMPNIKKIKHQLNDKSVLNKNKLKKMCQIKKSDKSVLHNKR